MAIAARLPLVVCLAGGAALAGATRIVTQTRALVEVESPAAPAPNATAASIDVARSAGPQRHVAAGPRVAEAANGSEPAAAAQGAAAGAGHQATSLTGSAAAWAAHLFSSPPRLSTLLAGLTFAAIVKSSCMASNVAVQLSPIAQVTHWASRGCTGEADAAPYVSIFFGGWQWCYYGLFAYFLTERSGFLILVYSNFLGALLGTYYLGTFVRNCRHGQAQGSLRAYLTGVAALVLLQASARAALPPERALFFTGLVASLCSFLGAMSMLVTVPTVLRTKNSRSVPGPLVVANFFSAVVWCMCGWMLSDPMVLAPNIVAMLASSTCIYLKQRYPALEEGEEVDAQVADCKLSFKPSPKAVSQREIVADTVATPRPVKPPAAAAGGGADAAATGGTC